MAKAPNPDEVLKDFVEASTPRSIHSLYLAVAKLTYPIPDAKTFAQRLEQSGAGDDIKEMLSLALTPHAFPIETAQGALEKLNVSLPEGVRMVPTFGGLAPSLIRPGFRASPSFSVVSRELFRRLAEWLQCRQACDERYAAALAAGEEDQVANSRRDTCYLNCSGANLPIL